jgi:hypothetical protein
LVDNGEGYASGQIAEALVYWPYVKMVDGVEVAGTSSRTNERFVDWAMSFYRAAVPKLGVSSYNIEYVVLSGAELCLPVSFAVPATLVFENATHRIFRLSGES